MMLLLLPAWCIKMQLSIAELKHVQTSNDKAATGVMILAQSSQASSRLIHGLRLYEATSKRRVGMVGMSFTSKASEVLVSSQMTTHLKFPCWKVVGNPKGVAQRDLPARLNAPLIRLLQSK